MAKALKLIIKYISYLVIGTIAGSLLYTMYFNLLNFVPDGIKQKILFGDFLRNFFKVLSYFIFIVTPLIICHKLKRKSSVFQCLAFILLSGISWIILLPLSVKTYNKLEDRFPLERKFNPLSKDEFRQYENQVYYFSTDYNPDSKDSEINEIPSVVINTDDSEGFVKVEKIPESKDFELVKAAGPYRDILIKNAFSSKKQNLLNVENILRKLNLAMEKGWTFLLGFMSLGFVLCAIYGLSNLSSWRLVNSANVIFITLAVILVNANYSEAAGNFLRKSALTNNRFFEFLSNYVDEPFLCLLNVITGLIFIIIGIVRLIISNKIAKSAKDGE